MALETTATFIGHNECFGLSAEKLKNTIRELIEKGVTDFLSGGQGGFDRLCGRCVYELKKEYPHINNYLIVRQYEMTPALVRRGFACHTLDANQM